MTGIGLISQERIKQVDKLGHSLERDKAYYPNGELDMLATYCISTDDAEESRIKNYLLSKTGISNEYLNSLKRKSRRERLIIAGALIAAELDRIQ